MSVFRMSRLAPRKESIAALRHRLDPISGVFFLFAGSGKLSFASVIRHIFMFKGSEQRVNRLCILFRRLILIGFLTES